MDDEQRSFLLESLVRMRREREWVEFKVNHAEPHEIGKYISALSNSACLHGQPHGYLVFGVEDGSHEVKGTQFCVSEAKKGNEPLESWINHLLSPRIDFRVHEWVHGGKPMVLLEIDATKGTPVMFEGEAYIRVGTTTKNLKGYSEKARRIWTSQTPAHFEAGIAADGLSPLAVLSLLNYPIFFSLLQRRQPPGVEGIMFELESEGVVVRSADDRYDITNAGALLFANKLADFNGLSSKAVRLIFYKGKNKLKTEREIDGVYGYAVGFQGLVGYILDRLPQNEVISAALRQEVKMYPELAIREVVANALVHQDLSQRGTSPMVEVFEDRIEVINNGRPLINPLRFLDEVPKSRNEVIAGMMRKLGICEERGSGIDKVVHAAEEYLLPPPDFLEQENHTKAILYAARALGRMSKAEKIRACYQHACLRFVSNDQMTNASLRERFRIPPQNHTLASRIIADTIAEGLIVDFDPANKSKRHARYVPFWVRQEK